MKCLKDVFRWASSPSETTSLKDRRREKVQFSDELELCGPSLSLPEVLVVRVGVNPEQPFQDCLCNPHEVFREGNTCNGKIE